MNDLEDRLRDAFRAAADTVDPATVATSPLRARPRAALSRRVRILAPLAAAAAVAIVVAVTAAVGSVAPRHQAQATRPRPAAPAAILPAYTLVDAGSALQVYATRTGAVVASVAAPAGQKFEDVASAGTAGTFLAATGSSGSACHAYFYRFELSASGQPSALTTLRSVPDSQPTAVVGIPGGQSYAYSTVHCDTAPPNGGVGIGGPAGDRSWTYPTGDDYADSLSATADGRTIALSFFVYGPGFQDMLLNTTSPATAAVNAARGLPAVPVSPTLAISPDGKTIYGCASNGTTGTLAGYSVATGAQLRVLHQWPVTDSGGAAGSGNGYDTPGFSCQISTDATGRYLLAAVSLDTTLKHWTLTGFDLQTGASAKVPIRPNLPFRGSQLSW